MANNFFRALGLVGAIAFIPAATASIAQVDVDSVREIDQFMTVLERVKAEYVDQVDDETADPRRHRRHARQPRSAQLLSRRARLPHR